MWVAAGSVMPDPGLCLSRTLLPHSITVLDMKYMKLIEHRKGASAYNGLTVEGLVMDLPGIPYPVVQLDLALERRRLPDAPGVGGTE